MPKYKIIQIVEIEADDSTDALENMHWDKNAQVETNVFCTAPRVCSECGKGMKEGYLAGYKYYCSDECRRKYFTDEEWERLYKDCPDSFYYTEWEEFDNEDDKPEPKKRVHVVIDSGLLDSVYTDVEGLEFSRIDLDVRKNGYANDDPQYLEDEKLHETITSDSTMKCIH